MSRPTDAQIVDVIAVGLGRADSWSGADDLDWIASVVGTVRPHPGNLDGDAYVAEFERVTGRDPERVDEIPDVLDTDPRATLEDIRRRALEALIALDDEAEGDFGLAVRDIANDAATLDALVRSW